jgi:hypothetical protein
MSDSSLLPPDQSIRGGWRERLRQAFAVAPPGGSLSEESQALADRIAQTVSRRGLAVPAVMLLEMSRPLNYVAAQALHGLTPLLGSLVGDARVRGFAELLEQRGAVDYLCQRLESRPSAPDQPAP